jgi:hypothetical protein
MRMVQQVLTPGMEYGEEADASAEVPWIGRDFQQASEKRRETTDCRTNVGSAGPVVRVPEAQ